MICTQKRMKLVPRMYLIYFQMFTAIFPQRGRYIISLVILTPHLRNYVAMSFDPNLF